MRHRESRIRTSSARRETGTEEAEAVLVHVIRRFHYEIDNLLPGDVIGWRLPHTIRKNLAEFNPASGTAVQIQPGHYPPASRGGFFPQQQSVIRDILAELKGVIRWSGDDRKPDESLFSIGRKPGDAGLAKIARQIQKWADVPGLGAGSNVDSPARRKTARALERLQEAPR
jgi:hypothetical protein